MKQYRYRGFVRVVEQEGEAWLVTLSLPEYGWMRLTFPWNPTRGPVPKVGEETEITLEDDEF